MFQSDLFVSRKSRFVSVTFDHEEMSSIPRVAFSSATLLSDLFRCDDKKKS